MTAEEMLRLQIICNSLQAILQSPEVHSAAMADESLIQFLRKDLPLTIRRAEKQFKGDQDGDSPASRVTLELLREDHRRLHRLARAAADAVEEIGKLDQDDSVVREEQAADIRRYLAAQRHQLAWYRDNLS